jgi:hypothetical protein
MLLIGDVHGLFFEYKEILRKTGVKKSLQLGDFGLGFPNSPTDIDLEDIKGTHLFLRGNHDNPKVCQASSYYVGDYGILKGKYIDGMYNKLMYISGAWSIDRHWRTPGKDWWSEEQIEHEGLLKALNLYIKHEPSIVVSHDCPLKILNELYAENGHVFPTRTGQAMDAMINHKMPSYWFFAHHHISWRKVINKCTFVCLNELEILDISKRI